MLGSWSFRPPQASPTSFPTLPSLNLSAQEMMLLHSLTSKALADRGEMLVTDAYYKGEQRLRQLGISVPPELAILQTLVGWPRIAVDPYVERIAVDGFRLAGATDSDEDLHELWTVNGLDAELPLAVTDALSMRRAYWTVGTNPDGGRARICAESPLNLTVLWDGTGRKAKSALQSYFVGDQQHAALMIPGQNIHVAQNENKEWVLVDRDYYDESFGVPVIRMANNPRTGCRDGYSEITPELRSIVDAACRALLNLTVASEFYSVPQKAILGASEEQFKDAQGRTKTGWESSLSKFLAFPRDEEGNAPTLFQFTAYDPAVYTKVVEHYASQAAGILAASPQDLGLYTQGNPVNAEAWAASEGRRDRRAIRKEATFGVSLIEVMQTALRWERNGTLDDKYARMAVDWAPVSIETPAQTADAITKYVAAGVLPPKSDVTRKKAGLSAVERAQVAQDDVADEAQQVLRELATNIEAKDVKTGAGLVKAADTPTSAPVKSSGDTSAA